jgi:hypothetical protein
MEKKISENVRHNFNHITLWGSPLNKDAGVLNLIVSLH